jgi:hypothetical protein
MISIYFWNIFQPDVVILCKIEDREGCFGFLNIVLYSCHSNQGKYFY